MSGDILSCGTVTEILGTSGVTTVTSGQAKYKDGTYASFQATVRGTGQCTATVVIECSNDTSGVLGSPAVWCATPLGTITISGDSVASDGFTTQAPWKFIRARVSQISGTNATVTVTLGT